MSNGPLGPLKAQDCLLLERIETGSLRRGRHRLFVGEEVQVDFGYHVLGSAAFPLLLASLDPYASCETGNYTSQVSTPICSFGCLLGVKESSRTLFPRWCELFDSWRDYWYDVTNRFAIS
jgi:hypothetical protein